MNIKAIETQYKGYRFRSRLEARWAVFFDALGVEWEYEAEGFDLGNEGFYLPDFWLPKFCGYGMFAEVKHTGGSFDRATTFCRVTGHPIWLCEGTPSNRAYLVLELLEGEISYVGKDALLPKKELHVVGFEAIPNADQAEGENRMFWQPGYENSDLSIPDIYRSCLGETFLNAVSLARSARFEHGETPRI